MEDEAECWDYEKLSVLSLRQKYQRPALLRQRCTWVVLTTEGDVLFDYDDQSTISIICQDAAAAGVTIHPKRRAFKVWDFILVPVCIDQDALVGECRLVIENDVENTDKPWKVIIETNFEIQ
jgi:hypothetical protein